MERQHVTRLTLDPDAYEEGFRAGLTGQPSTACPYPPARGVAAWSWQSGYIEGKAAV